jgi:hypothetical protein
VVTVLKTFDASVTKGPEFRPEGYNKPHVDELSSSNQQQRQKNPTPSSESVGGQNAKDHTYSWFGTIIRASLVAARSEPLFRSQRWTLSHYLSVRRPVAGCAEPRRQEFSKSDPWTGCSARCLTDEPLGFD